MIFLMVSILIGCESGGLKPQSSNNESTIMLSEPLTIYLSGTSHSFMQEDGEVLTLYPSKVSIGTHMVAGEFDSLGGNAFAEALRQYSEIKNIPLEIHFLEEFTGLQDIMQQKYEQDELPDLWIVGKHNRYDYAVLAEHNILLDLSPYFPEEEKEKYYYPVLQGGYVGDSMIAAPLLFNLNGLVTHESFVDRVGMELPDLLVYDQVLEFLERACLEMVESTQIEAIFEASGNMSAGRYIPSILLSSAYPSYFDGQKILIEEEILVGIFNVMQAFNQQEFIPIQGWQEETYASNVNGRNKWSYLKMLEDENSNKIGVFLSGGRCGGANLHNSLLTDVQYFHSVWKDDMIFRAIPSVQGDRSFSANISLAAMGFSSTEHPEVVADIIKYLMDYEFPAYYGFSIQREITEKQLKNAANTEMTLYPDYIWSSITAGDTDLNDLELYTEEMKPLDEESIQTIRFMLSHIAGASMPSETIEYRMMASAQNAIGNHTMTSLEAAEWMIEKIKEYQQERGNIRPFYDAVYLETISIPISEDTIS